MTTDVLDTAPDPLVGVTIDHRFKITGLIGKGAMGRVYRAVQMPLNRPVALKVLDSSRGPGREQAFVQRFLVEAALTAKLSHPNTIRVLDYGVTPEGLFYLAMEHLDGETLESLLKKGPLPWRRVLSIGQQTARALREAHGLGVVHRDLKPGNIMLLSADDETDHVKVLDFGLVKSFVEGHELEGRAITQQGMLMGSPPYMAPEQGEQNVADPRSDVYSLGVVLFEALQGRPPFVGKQPLEIILKHVHDPVPQMFQPMGLEPIPARLEALVRRCLAKSPMDRFQSMDELLQAFSELLQLPVPTPVAMPAQVRALTPKGPPEISPPLTSGSAIPYVPLPPPAPGQPQPAPYVTGAVEFPERPKSNVGVLVAAAAVLGALVGGLLLWVLPLSKRDAAAPAPGVDTSVQDDMAPLPLPSAPGLDQPPSGRVLFHVETEPSGVAVSVDGELLGTTPLDAELPAKPDGSAVAEFVLSKAGFVTVTVRAQGKGRVALRQSLAVAPEEDLPTVERLPPEKRRAKRVEQRPEGSSPKPSKLNELDDPMAPHEPPSQGELKRPRADGP